MCRKYFPNIDNGTITFDPHLNKQAAPGADVPVCNFLKKKMVIYKSIAPCANVLVITYITSWARVEEWPE